MNANNKTSENRGRSLESFAADLTVAAYSVALERGMEGSWLDLQVEIWMVLVETLKHWDRAFPEAGWPGKFAGWREDFLRELTDAAYRTTLKYGIHGSSLKARSALYQAFHAVVEDVEQAMMLTS
jgi:hypothetical protein